MEVTHAVVTDPLVYLQELRETLADTVFLTNKDLSKRIYFIAQSVFELVETLQIFSEPVRMESMHGRYDLQARGREDFGVAYAKFLNLSKKIDVSKEDNGWSAIYTTLSVIGSIFNLPQNSYISKKLYNRNDTTEEIPRTVQIYDIIPTSDLKKYQKMESEFSILCAYQDHLRQPILLSWFAGSCLLEIVDELLQMPNEERDFAVARSQLKQKLDNLKQEELANFRALLGTRNRIILDGKFVDLDKELTSKLIKDFTELVTERCSLILAEFTTEQMLHLEALKEKLKKRTENLCLISNELLEIKMIAGMKAEDACQTAAKLASSFILPDLWNAAENGDLNLLVEELQKCSFFARFLPFESRFINQRNALGYCSLAIASFKGHKDLVDRLLEFGASPLIADYNGYQPLHWAAKRGFTSICQKLLAADSSLLDSPAMVKNDAGLDVGVFRNEEGQEFGGYGRTPLHNAAYHGQTDTVKFLLSAGANPNIRTTRENGSVTPLHEAVEQGRNNIIIELLKSNPLDVEITDEQGRSAIAWAVKLGKTDLVKLISSHSSYIRKKDPQDINSPAHLLLINPEENGNEIRNFLQTLE